MKKITRFQKLLIIFIVISLTYLFGVVSYRNNLEPVKSLRKLKNTVVKNPKLDNQGFYKMFVDQETSHFKYLYDSINPKFLRNQILTQSIVDDFEIKRSETNLDCYGDIEILETKFYDIKQKGVFKNRDKKKLFIYFQGHGGNPCNFDYFKNLYSNLKEFDILTFSMFGLGFNQIDSIGFPVKLPNHTKTYDYTSSGYSRLRNHDIIQHFFDEKNPELIPLSIFISSPYLIINEIIENKEYDEVVISGISGGGWYSTILSGLIPKINRLYSFNGTLPFIYRIGTDSNGDYEQQFSKLWEKYDYYTFYFLSTFDEENNRTRLSYHLYSKNDECCFSSPEINFFKKTIDDLDISNVKIRVFDKVEHNIDDRWLFKELNK